MPKKRNDLIEAVDEKLEMFKEHLDRHMECVHGKLEKLDERVDSIDKTLVQQHSSLEEHIRRTEILEGEIKPLRDQGLQLKLIIKILAAVLAAGASGLGIKELLAIFAG